MFFSLCNSPPTFQNMMDKIFIMETHKGWIIIYMDDILIFSKDRKELEVNTWWVLQKLKDNDFFLNLDKCVFDVKEVEYLGMVIQENQIKMERTKLEEIINWSTPMTVKQVWSFLGFGNFYRKFIGHYVNIAQSNKWPNKEGSSLELDWWLSTSIQWSKGSIYWSTCPPNIQYSETFCGRTWCFKMNNRGSPTTTRW